MAEAQDGGLIRQPGELEQLCKFPLQRYIEEGIFRGWIRQGEPQLQEVCAQHGPRERVVGHSCLPGSRAQ